MSTFATDAAGARPRVFGLLLATGVVGPALAALPTVPEGFKIRLVAAVPAVQYPCQVATAPDGSLFVGEDPMDQVGPASKPIDRILLFRDGKDPVVFADKLNAIFGMVWHNGALYVMNMPHLTVLRDRDGDGKADERKELFTDLGVPAGSPNDFNDHIVSGLKIGIDGYLYISVGDKGVPRATGPDGRTAQVVGGGVLRAGSMAPGSRFSRRARAIISSPISTIAITSSLTTTPTTAWDGGRGSHIISTAATTAIRLTITPGKDRMLPRMAEYGGGSPCGGVYYGEDVWPAKYRGPALLGRVGQARRACDPVRTRRLDVQGGREDRLCRTRQGRRLPSARPRASLRRHDDVYRRLVDGGLEQQDRETGTRLRGDLRRASPEDFVRAGKTPTRSRPRFASSTILHSTSGFAPRPH